MTQMKYLVPLLLLCTPTYADEVYKVNGCYNLRVKSGTLTHEQFLKHKEKLDLLCYKTRTDGGIDTGDVEDDTDDPDTTPTDDVGGNPCGGNCGVGGGNGGGNGTGNEGGR